MHIHAFHILLHYEYHEYQYFRLIPNDIDLLID